MDEGRNNLIHCSQSLRHGGVVPNCELTSTNNPYSHYICFTISVRTNKLQHYQNRYTERQEETHSLIKFLHDGGMGYRKISHYLNDRGITTSKGNRWQNTQVYSVLKRYKERLERRDFIKQDYEPVWGRMEVKLLRDSTRSHLK